MNNKVLLGILTIAAGGMIAKSIQLAIKSRKEENNEVKEAE